MTNKSPQVTSTKHKKFPKKQKHKKKTKKKKKQKTQKNKNQRIGGLALGALNA